MRYLFQYAFLTLYLYSEAEDFHFSFRYQSLIVVEIDLFHENLKTLMIPVRIDNFIYYNYKPSDYASP